MHCEKDRKQKNKENSTKKQRRLDTNGFTVVEFVALVVVLLIVALVGLCSHPGGKDQPQQEPIQRPV
jgi:hypothetical protein